MSKQPAVEQADTISIPADARPYTKWIDADLTCRQAAILAIVTANPGVTVGAVALVLDVPKPSVSRAADKLFDWGLMHRTHHAEDRRLVQLHAGKAAPARMGQSTRRGG
jgi:DNA-binding MarR family transcriptional regulator